MLTFRNVVAVVSLIVSCVSYAVASRALRQAQAYDERQRASSTPGG